MNNANAFIAVGDILYHIKQLVQYNIVEFGKNVSGLGCFMFLVCIELSKENLNIVL